MSTESQLLALQSATSVVALDFQIAATALVAVITFVLSRAFRRSFRPWTAGWTCYTAALLSVLFAFRTGRAGVFFLFGYFFFEYVAMLFIFAACRNTASGSLPRRTMWLLIAPAAVIAAVLAGPALAAFAVPFGIHSTIMGLSWAACLAALWPALRVSHSGPGVRMVAVGLVLLSLDFLQHLPTALYTTARHLAISPYYYTITALIDGMLDLVLGFGAVVVIVDHVRAELERANVHLKVAHEQAEEALHTDPLTEALTRYSFELSFRDAKAMRIESGAVVVADLDDLKRINDSHGHGAGDAALRAVAQGLRAIVRANDLVYRWGGDEFVVVMAGAPEELARRRMEGLNAACNRCAQEAGQDFGTIGVSFGVAPFGEGAEIEAAIAAADAAMYAAKSADAVDPQLRGYGIPEI